MNQPPRDAAHRQPSVDEGKRAALSNGLEAFSDAQPGDQHRLIAAVIDGLLDDFLPNTRFGSLNLDLLAYASATADMLRHSAMKALIVEIIGGTGHVAPQAADAMAKRMKHAGDAIIARAVLRGEVGAWSDPGHVVDAVIAPVWLRGLLGGPRHTDRQLAALAEQAVRAAQAT